MYSMILKTSQQEGSGFGHRSQLGPFCPEIACVPRACVDFFRILRFPKDGTFYI